MTVRVGVRNVVTRRRGRSGNRKAPRTATKEDFRMNPGFDIREKNGKVEWPPERATDHLVVLDCLVWCGLCGCCL